MQSSVNLGHIQRRLILIRHAKAVEEDVAGDHARGLSDRGKADATALNSWLSEQRLAAELVLCSTAIRTRQTLEALEGPLATILSDKLYLASPAEMLALIQATDDMVRSLMVIGHNPGAHALVALLVSEYVHEADAERLALKFPTSACAVMEFSASRWSDLAPHSARLTHLR